VLTMQAGDVCADAEITVSVVYGGTTYDSNTVQVAIGVPEVAEREVSAEGELAYKPVTQYAWSLPSTIEAELTRARDEADTEAEQTAQAALDSRVQEAEAAIARETANTSCRAPEFSTTPTSFVSMLALSQQYYVASNKDDPKGEGPRVPPPRLHVVAQRFRATTKVRYTTFTPGPSKP
jgi:hypothetical protein